MKLMLFTTYYIFLRFSVFIFVSPGMLSLEAKFCGLGLILFGLGLVLGLVGLGLDLTLCGCYM